MRPVLRPLADADSEPLFAWINDKDLVVLNAPFRPVSAAEHGEWFAGIRKRDDLRIFAIADPASGKTVGYCQLKKIDRQAGSAELQIRIGDRVSQGKGLGTRAVRELLSHAFSELGLRKVYLQVFADNERAFRTYEKCGFQVTGVVRDAVRIDGVPKDIREMAAVRQERPSAAGLPMGRTVACHQPNFLPWLGFFAKMARADIFVLLDDVQFTQGANKHNWTTRVRILTANGPVWLSVPVRRAGEGKQRISDLRADPDDRRWLAKMLKTLEEAYRKAPYAAESLPALLATLSGHDGSVCEANIKLIEQIAALLGIEARRLRSSARSVPGAGTGRLVNLTLAEGGTAYLSGDGADDYQVETDFRTAGLEFRKLGFRHPEYPQRRGEAFVPGLSIVDALCRSGIAATRSMLRDCAPHD